MTEVSAQKYPSPRALWSLFWSSQRKLEDHDRFYARSVWIGTIFAGFSALGGYAFLGYGIDYIKGRILADQAIPTRNIILMIAAYVGYRIMRDLAA